MQFSIRIPQYLILVVWIFLSLSMCVSPFLSTSRPSESLILCGQPARDSNSGIFIQNLNRAMDSLYLEIQEQRYGTAYVISPPPVVYSLAQCHRDLSTPDCEVCFAALRGKAMHCRHADSASIFLDGCFLRYDNYNFFNESINPKTDKVNCSSRFLDDESLSQQYENNVAEVIMNLTNQAKKNSGFAILEDKGGLATVYALAQCLDTLSEEGCGNCLDEASYMLKTCKSGAEGRAMLAGCFVRYSNERFFSNATVSTDHGDFSRITIAIVVGVTGFTVLSCIGAFIGYKRLSKMRKDRNSLGATSNMSNLNFKYEILEKATDFFDNSRKLGQGGAGSVFRGTLPDGRDVAVKKLFFNTRQWVDQFFNEVNLISGIQHKNVVRLLGCSIEGPESLLVYEYVPNRSLDQILFVKNTIHILSWQQRFNIICGTAEGLAYLHGGLGTKIVHRDIKTSNILLDEKLTPKIADFGLARCVGSDKSHVSTGIAGTLGYMAPEYLVRGQLTEKADVYAFGVLVIEIASGRRNSVFSEGSSSVLHNVWKHYKTNMITQSVDPGLRNKFPEKEASKVFQIGLLCTQASVALRPSMSEVVNMLYATDFVIPSPRQPPFLNASVISPAETTKTSSLGSFKSFVSATPDINQSSVFQAFEPS